MRYGRRVLTPVTPARPLTLALVLPGCAALLGLFGTTCGGVPPRAEPGGSGAEIARVDASSSGWALPDVPLVARSVILLEPPVRGPDASAIRAIAPDPSPLVEQNQWVYDLRYERGDILLGGVHETTLDTPRATPRVMGRFALELYSGPTLIERVRFDFPGLDVVERAVTADAGPRRPIHGDPISFTAKVKTRVGVMMPATSRGTRLSLWDRATDRRWPLPWPPVEMSADPIDAGAR